MGNRKGNSGNSIRRYFGGSKITADGDCSHEIKRRLLLGRKVMTNLDSILISRDISLPTKVHLVKAMVLRVVMYGCESWTMKKAEHRRIDAFELWCWRRLLRVSWTARRFNQLTAVADLMFSSVQSPSHVPLFATPWIAAWQASLSITNSRSSLKLMSIELVMPFSNLIHCCPLLLLPSIPSSIRVFSNESTLRMRWPKYWSFSFSISPSKNTQEWSPLGWTGWISLQSKGLSRVFNTTVQKHQFFGAQLSS